MAGTIINDTIIADDRSLFKIFFLSLDLAKRIQLFFRRIFAIIGLIERTLDETG